jgi:hypothetical protein
MAKRKKRSIRLSLLDSLLYALSCLTAIGVFWWLATSSAFVQ